MRPGVVSQAMPKGKGIVSKGMAFGTSLFTDVAGVTMQGVRQVRSMFGGWGALFLLIVFSYL